MIREGLTFDDVLLVPQHSAVESRSRVDLSVILDGLRFYHPIIPANMKTIAGAKMAYACAQQGGLAILHRFMEVEEQVQIAKDIISADGPQRFAISVGVKASDRAAFPRFYEVGVRTFCIDIAHGDSVQCSEMIHWMRSEFPDLFIIAGNVATGEGARRLWEAGANVVKVGVGPGSLCTTRIETGNGVPQLSALMDVSRTQKYLLELNRSKPLDQQRKSFPFIADGGIKSAGDVVKALCFADMVMAGNVFAGCVETPGNIINIDGRPHKEYVGSSTYKGKHVEGVAAIVPCKGTFESVLNRLLDGLRSGCSYQGAHTLTELRDNPELIRITNAGLKESHPHDVIIR